MIKIITSILFSFMIVVTASATTGPIHADPADESFGSCDPILGNWLTDPIYWIQKANAPSTFRRAACGAIGNYWYCFGDQYTPTAQAFNLMTEEWEISTEPPFGGTCNWPGVVVDDQLYLIGGYNPGYLDVVQRFTPSAGGPTGTWDQMAPYPIAACGIAAAWDGGDHIYAAGGNPSPSTAAYVYSISGDTWTAIASLPMGLAYTGGAFCGDKFHVIGGIANPNAHYAYDPGTDTWAAAAPVPTAIYFATFSVSNDPWMDHLYSIGGGGGYGSWPATDAVQVYDAYSDTWFLENVLPVAYGTNSASYVGDGSCMSAGGYDGTTNHAETYQGVPYWEPQCVIDLTYLSGSPVPESGGSLYFEVEIENSGVFPVNFDAWLDVEYEGGDPVTVVQRYFSNFMPGSVLYRPDAWFPVPGNWAAGSYEMWGRIGLYGGPLPWDEDVFPFEKLGTSNDSRFQPWVLGAVPNPFDEITIKKPNKIDEFRIIGNYPNPFNPVTTINFELSDAGMTTLTVYDMTGRKVTDLVDGYYQIGVYKVIFDASKLPSGIYIYKVTSGDQTAVSKMLLMK